MRSLNIHQNSISISIRLLNIQKKQKVSRKITSIYPNVYITFFKYNQKCSDVEKKALAANHRVVFLNELLKKNFKKIFYLDCDSIIRSNITKEIIKQPEADISIIFRHQGDERSKVATGAILLKNSNNTKKFIERWKEKIQPVQQFWFSDQITFYETYNETKTFINFCDLPYEMNDWNFYEKSKVWAGKGSRKKDNLIYLVELLKNRLQSNQIKNFLFKIQEFLRKLNLYKET